MTDETEAKILNLESLAKSVGKEEQFGKIPMEALVYLTGLSVISGSELMYFIEGFFFGHKGYAFTPSEEAPIGEVDVVEE